jgi:cytochrome c oxidase subunit 2
MFYSKNFQDPATAVMEGIIDFHHDLQFILIVIVTFVGWMLFSIVFEFGYKLYINKNSALEETLEARRFLLVTGKVTHGTILEIIWTLIPIVVLITIAIPSFSLLYAIDEMFDPELTIKVTGHQWYWSYSYVAKPMIVKGIYVEPNNTFDSYMIPENDLQLGEHRLLQVDKALLVPADTALRFLITSVDVIHSWAVPSLGIKVDALPGRINSANVYVKRLGVFYGQCSEICGVNHGFMPIVVQVVTPMEFALHKINLCLTRVEEKTELQTDITKLTIVNKVINNDIKKI